MNESKLKLEKLVSESRKKGLKLTPQRMIIFNIFAESNRHMTADEIYNRAKVQYPMLSPATVYRNMEQMVGAGLLTHLALGGSPVKYDTNLDEHHHFVCKKCGKVIDLYLKDFNYEVDSDKSHPGDIKVDSTQLYLRGVCGECL